MKIKPDKKFRTLERKYAERMRREGRQLEMHVVDGKAHLVARPKAKPGAPFVKTPKGMRWELGVLVPRKPQHVETCPPRALMPNELTEDGS